MWPRQQQDHERLQQGRIVEPYRAVDEPAQLSWRRPGAAESRDGGPKALGVAGDAAEELVHALVHSGAGAGAKGLLAQLHKEGVGIRIAQAVAAAHSQEEGLAEGKQQVGQTMRTALGPFLHSEGASQN